MSGHTTGNFTPGPWFVRHCDDERHMCMTVISTKDYGPSNDSQFDGKADTVAVTYHQCAPFVSGGFEIDDCDERDANAILIAAAPNLLDSLQSLLPFVVTEVLEHCDGNKCREQWCAGCMGEESAMAAVETSNRLYQAARSAIAKATGESA